MDKLIEKNWKKTLIFKESSLIKAIKALEKNGLQILLVVDSNDEFIGTLTDGDIRRAILKKIDLKSPVYLAMNSNPIVTDNSIDNEVAKKIMLNKKIQKLPIVEDGKVIGIFDLMSSEVSSKIDNPFLIMAGGKGLRLGSITKDKPKPMVEVSGKPLIQRIIENAKEEGFINFYISLNYLKNRIVEFLEKNENFGVNINFIVEKKPLGTAGAISLFKPDTDLPFLVTNADVLTNLNYHKILKFHSKRNSHATMAVNSFIHQNSYGVVHADGFNITGFEEKPISYSLINAGVYVLNHRCISELSANEYCDMPDLFLRLKDKKYKTIIYPIYESWVDVGKPEDISKAEEIKFS